jgi:class 3 adenylate cyclase
VAARLLSVSHPQLGAQASAKAAKQIRVKHEELDPSVTLEEERKTITTLFADIKGSTELMEDFDPERRAQSSIRRSS